MMRVSNSCLRAAPAGVLLQLYDLFVPFVLFGATEFICSFFIVTLEAAFCTVRSNESYSDELFVRW